MSNSFKGFNVVATSPAGEKTVFRLPWNLEVATGHAVAKAMGIPSGPAWKQVIASMQEGESMLDMCIRNLAGCGYTVTIVQHKVRS